MLDRDLAELYGMKPVRLMEQVKRNLSRFPSNFMFQLTENEVDSMVSQNAIPSKQHLGGYLPYLRFSQFRNFPPDSYRDRPSEARSETKFQNANSPPPSSHSYQSY